MAFGWILKNMIPDPYNTEKNKKDEPVLTEPVLSPALQPSHFQSIPIERPSVKHHSNDSPFPESHELDPTIKYHLWK